MKYAILLIISLLITTGCQEVITVDLEQGSERLVVEGRVEKIKGVETGYQRITLSTTGEYFANAQTPRIRNARVVVLDEQGVSYIFSESPETPGRYETNNLFARIGGVYTLNIVYNNETYTASERLNPVAPIDTVYQRFVEKTGFDEEGIRIKIDYTDPAYQENYYYWEQYRNGESTIRVNPGTKWSLLSDDRYTNGQTVKGKTPNDELIYAAGDLALVRQLSLTKLAYDYHYYLFKQLGDRGLFDTPPAPIRGNIENITNPENYALGYFGASEISEARLIIR